MCPSRLLIFVAGIGVCLVLVRCAAVRTEVTGPTDSTPMEYHVLQERPDRLLVALPNRMIVIAQELHASPVVTARVVVKTGSIYEQQHVGAGLSHFLEHLVSGGTTERRTEAESNAVLGRIGAITNASTGLDRVRYYINTTSAHTAQAIDLLADWVLHCRIQQREFDRERDVIQREFEMGQGEPRRIYWKLTQQARFRLHPARHPTIGYLDEFLRITRDDIYRFYKRMYVPNNMVFIVTGDIDKQKVVDQIAGLCNNVPARKLPDLRFPTEPSVDAPRSLHGTADINKPRFRLAWPGTRLAGEGDYALDLIAVILGQGESSRLVRTVRDKHRAVNTISAYNVSFSWGEGFFGIDAEVAEARPNPLPSDQAIERARNLILEQVHQFLSAGVLPEELARAKRTIMADVIYSGQSAEALADRLSSDLIAMGDPDYLRRYARRIQDLTEQDLMTAAKRFLADKRLIMITLSPTGKEGKPDPLTRPAEQQLPADTFESVELDNAVLTDRVRSNVSAAADDAIAIVTDPVRKFVLPNGLRLLVGRSTLVPAVSIHMYQLGGLLADDPGREGLTNATARMRIRGTRTRSAEQIARQIDSLGASLDTDSGFNSSFTRAVCLKQDLEIVLDLFADVVLNPAFPEDEWTRLRPRLVASIRRQTDSWYGELHRHFRENFFAGHPWSQTPLGQIEVIEKITPQDLRHYYGERCGARNSVLAVFGDVDPTEVKSLVGKLFVDLPENPHHSFKRRQPPHRAPDLLQFTTGKPLGAVQIGFGPGPVRTSPDYPAVRVLTRVLSRFPSGWLDQQLRGEGEGLVYAIGCGQFTGLVPGYVSILFNATPQKLPEALRRTSAVVERARSELVDEGELEHAKAAVLTSEFLGKQSNSDRAAQFALDELYGLGLDETEHFIRQIDRLDTHALRDIARKFLRNPVTVVLSHEPLAEEALNTATRSLASRTGSDED